MVGATLRTVKSSREGSQLYISADLTDRYAIRCRPIDVCGLETAGDGRFKASFWQWFWDPVPNPLDIRPLLPELRAARCTMLDGPQGLARPGRSMRGCDRAAGAAAKVPGERPSRSLPFGGFVCSSLDLFQALADAGLEISPTPPGCGVGEVYPGLIWPRLTRNRLPKKSTKVGVAARTALLRALGVDGIPASVNHDQLDAAIGAVVAAAAAGAFPGIRADSLGEPLYRDNGVLREGPMIIPVVTSQELVDRLAAVPIPAESDSPEGAAPPELPSAAVPPSAAGAAAARAQDLLRWFVRQAAEGHPHVCTYSWAHAYLTGKRVEIWSQAYTQAVLRIATSTTPLPLPGLGDVRLDAFIVRKEDGEPGPGHWEAASYNAPRWREVFHGANTLREDPLKSRE